MSLSDSTFPLLQKLVETLLPKDKRVQRVIGLGGAAWPIIDYFRKGPIVAQFALDVVQAVGCAVALCVITMGGPPGPAVRPSGVAVQFKGTWRSLWASWFLLYLLLAVADYHRGQGGADFPSWGRLAANVLNDFQTLFLLLLCWLMRSTRTRDRDDPSGSVKWFLPGLVMVLGLGVVEVSSHIAHVRATEPFVDVVDVIFGSLSGVIAAFAFALFAGTFESPLLKTPIYMLICFYAYAAIQPLFPFFRLDKVFAGQGGEVGGMQWGVQTLQALLKLLAAAFKIALFFTVERARLDGRMREFFKAKRPPKRRRVDEGQAA